jgi:endonuclease YncB( thermonuclease family)
MPYENFEGDVIRPIEESVKDGDTLKMMTEIRLVGVDTPETKFALKETKKFDTLISLDNPRIKTFLKETKPNLRDYLKPKIENSDGQIGTNQFDHGKEATTEFTSVVQKIMTHNATNLILMTSIEVTDRYGRLLGYLNRKKTKKTGEILTDTLQFQNSFNMKMLDSGYGFMYLIYPNLIVQENEKIGDHGKLDIEKPIIATIVKTFKNAISSGRGLFPSKNSENPKTIFDPFEFRYLARLFDPKSSSKGPDRFCADMISGRLYPPHRYFEVPKENRLFFDKKHKKIAVKKYDPV